MEQRREHGAEWWETYFDREFARLYRPLLPRGLTRREAAGALEMLALPPGSRLLDLACGWGRHAREFARAGMVVTGLDRSAELLRQARAAQRRSAGARVGWVRADMRALPFRGVFDGVASLFSSLGYFRAEHEEAAVLRGVRDALRPGGVFLMEGMHRDLIAREYLERDWWEMEDGTHVWVERDFDAVRGVSSEWLRWRRPGGAEGEKHHQIRVRSASEWDALLRGAGLEPQAWYGDWQGAEFRHTSERLVVVAHRPGD